MAADHNLDAPCMTDAAVTVFERSAAEMADLFLRTG